MGGMHTVLYFCWISNYSDCLKKKYVGDWESSWISHIFHEASFLLKGITDGQIMVIKSKVFGRHSVGDKALSFTTVFVIKMKTSKN